MACVKRGCGQTLREEQIEMFGALIAMEGDHLVVSAVQQKQHRHKGVCLQLRTFNGTMGEQA